MSTFFGGFSGSLQWQRLWDDIKDNDNGDTNDNDHLDPPHLRIPNQRESLKVHLTTNKGEGKEGFYLTTNKGEGKDVFYLTPDVRKPFFPFPVYCLPACILASQPKFSPTQLRIWRTEKKWHCEDILHASLLLTQNFHQYNTNNNTNTNTNTDDPSKNCIVEISCFPCQRFI